MVTPGEGHIEYILMLLREGEQFCEGFDIGIRSGLAFKSTDLTDNRDTLIPSGRANFTNLLVFVIDSWLPGSACDNPCVLPANHP